MDLLQEYKRSAAATWATGDYDAMATTEGLYVTGERLVRRVAIGANDMVLDVACGTGNAALPAAAAGATVTGLDLTPQMLTTAAKRAAAAGYDIAWREGDVEALPFDDGAFDVVLSAFGAMFAPRHEVVADELARVLRPGGRLAMANWRPGGAIEEFFGTVMAFAPPPPEFVQPPLLWGDETHVRELFEGTGIELDFKLEEVTLRARSNEHAVELYTTNLGPVAQTRQAVQADGRWPALHDELTAFFGRHNTAGDGTLAWPAAYLLVMGHQR